MTEALDRIELKIPAKPEFIGIARLTTSGIANRMGYSYDDIEDIKIAVSEACTNAVNHAYKESEQGTVNVILNIYDDRIEILVVDQGQSFDYEHVIRNLEPINAEKAIEHMNEGGLGLFLIETLMDEVTISGHSGIIVKMTKFLRKDEVLRDANKVSSTNN